MSCMVLAIVVLGVGLVIVLLKLGVVVVVLSKEEGGVVGEVGSDRQRVVLDNGGIDDDDLFVGGYA